MNKKSDYSQELNELLSRKNVTEKEAFDFFDKLEGVGMDFMFGKWKGSGLHTNHPMDGQLELFDWYGKEFEDSENVHPLLFRHGHSKIYKIHPGRIPFSLSQKFKADTLRFIKPLFRLGKWFLKTNKSKARIRLLQFRGKLSVAMIYDDLAIYDNFRKVDENTVLGVMDLKGMEQFFFFILKRVEK